MADARTLSKHVESEPIPPMNLTYRITFKVLDLLATRYFNTHVSGRENLPPVGVGAVVIANHSSSIDPFVMAYAVHRTGHFIAKVEITEMPILGRWFKAVGSIPAQRDDRDTAALRAAMRALRGGGMLGLAPEGTRSPDGTLAEFDPGFVWLAARTGAVVVPTAVHGAYQLMPKGARYPRRGPLWIRIGKPISYADEGRRISRERLAELAEEARQHTLGMLADMARETGVPNPAVTD